jgi:hypothetical protein
VRRSLVAICAALVAVCPACGGKGVRHDLVVRDGRQMAFAIGGPLVEIHHLHGDVWQITVKEVRLHGGVSCWTLHALDRGYRMIGRTRCI